MKYISIIIAGFMFIQPGALSAQQTPSGMNVIKQMHQRYHNSWYTYMTFKQKTSFYKDGRIDHAQTWYEALSLPGKLAIKFDSLDSGTGLLFRQDSEYVFQQNKLVKQAPLVHALLVLGFDVYGQAPSITMQKLRKQGYDFNKTYQTKWKGRPVYVVGASNKNEKTNQFWIDKKRLYFVRLFHYNTQNGTVQETQFNDYKKAGGGWVAAEVLFYDDGTLKTKEAYTNIEVPPQLDASVFDTTNFEGATW